MIFKDFLEWLKEDKDRRNAIIFLTIFALILFALAISGIDFGVLMYSFVESFNEEYGEIGTYVGIFLISIIGNVTVIFPVPYLVALIVISINPNITINPLLLGIVAGLGAAIGETSAWLIGKASDKVVEIDKENNYMAKLIEAGYAPILIFIFAATPLPDDVFLAVLGLVGYPLAKALVWCFLGKISLAYSTVIIADFAQTNELGKSFLGLYGIDIDLLASVGYEISALPPPTFVDAIFSAIIWIASMAFVLTLAFVDWGKVYNRIRKKENSNEIE